jgi:hypothetical protein
VLGRFALGAPLALLALAREELQRLKAGERQAWLMWLSHGTLTLLMLLFIARYSVLPVWHYLLLISVPALSIAMIRSYYEHRPHAEPEQRTVINEAPGRGAGCSSTSICIWCITTCRACPGTTCPAPTARVASNGWRAAAGFWCRVMASFGGRME